MGISFVLGISTAVLWGISGLLGRRLVHQFGLLRGIVYERLWGLLLLTGYLMVVQFALGGLPWDAPLSAWAYGVLVAGINVVSTVLLLSATREGAVAVVVPISNSNAAITVLLSLFSGEHLTWITGVGIVAILFGVTFIALKTPFVGDALPSTTAQGFSIVLALAAAVGYGVSFWMLGFLVAPALGSAIPVWLTRFVSVGVLGVLALLRRGRQGLAVPRRAEDISFLLFSGLVSTGGFVLNNLGYQYGSVAVVTVLASLATAVTVLLASIFLKERLRPLQVAGVVLIVLGVMLL